MMDTLQNEVYTALVATGYAVHYFHPQEPSVLPCISWRESDNAEHGQADGNEYVTRVEYTIDLWGLTPETTSTMAQAIDTELSKLRLKRTFSHDLYEQETRIHHKNLRYSALIQGQTIYQ